MMGLEDPSSITFIQLRSDIYYSRFSELQRSSIVSALFRQLND